MPNHPRLCSLRPYAAFAALASFGIFANSARADLLLDHSTGVVRIAGIGGDVNRDDRSFTNTHQLRGNYFGLQPDNPIVTVSVNGNLFFGEGDGTGDYFVQLLGSEEINRIAPMWGDFKLGASGQVIETVTSDYYMVTWLGLEGEHGEAGTLDLQAIIIEQDTTLRGADFLAGDIIFSYGELSLYSAMNEVIIGLDEASKNYAAMPGHESMQGWHKHEYFGDLPVAANQYVLFRANGSSYDVTIETVIPEPTTYAAVAAVACLALALRCRRTRKA